MFGVIERGMIGGRKSASGARGSSQRGSRYSLPVIYRNSDLICFSLAFG